MDVRFKILRDLLSARSTKLPLVGGLALLVGGWVVGAGATVGYLGLAGILGGLGLAALRLVFGLKGITDNAYEYARAQQWKRQEKALNRLDRKLIRDRDRRTQDSLRRVRVLYATLVEDVRAGRIVSNSDEILEKVERLFQACVGQLERSFKLWKGARNVRGDARERLLEQREAVVQEVLRSVEHLEQQVSRLRDLSADSGEQDLIRLRDELDTAIDVARRTEQRLASWEKRPYEETEFE